MMMIIMNEKKTVLEIESTQFALVSKNRNCSVLRNNYRQSNKVENI